MNKRPAQKRLTKAEKKEREDFADRENRTREMLKDQIGRANALRSKEREFHGLNREFLFYQEDMLRLFERAKDSKHPRDIGLAREQIVRNFLVDTGLLPTRYAASDRSVRVASTTGHISGELDILQPGDVRIYNPDALPFSEILVMDRPFMRDGEQVNIKALAFDSIETNGMNIWIPYVYEVTRGIINSCPKCEQKKHQRSASVITAKI